MFSPSEIEKAKELKRLGFPRLKNSAAKDEWTPKVGQYLAARHCPAGCQSVAEGIHLILDPSQEGLTDAVWLPTLEDLFALAKKGDVSFSLITDYLHRKRFADVNEREGLYQLFIERCR